MRKGCKWIEHIKPSVHMTLRHHHSIRNIGFFDETDADYKIHVFADDLDYDFTQPVDWMWIQQWCECKDLVVSFKAKYRRFAFIFIRHLLAKHYRPATIQVRDMENMVFSIVRFDGVEKIVLDDLDFFKMEDGCVATR